MSILSALLIANLSFGAAQAFATIGAIAWNFVLNNLFTYRDQRLTGWHFVTGLIRFQVICAIGAISNVGIATWIYDYDETWWIAGLGGAYRHGLELRGQRRAGLAAKVADGRGLGSNPLARALRARLSRRGEANTSTEHVIFHLPLRGEAGRDSGRERGERLRFE